MSKANSTHISLETAKLLKDCAVKSKYKFFTGEWTTKKDIFGNEIINNIGIVSTYEDQHKYGYEDWCLPAYTWQEILWEYSRAFGIDFEQSVDILAMLKIKEYDEADQYFRDFCILIKK